MKLINGCNVQINICMSLVVNRLLGDNHFLKCLEISKIKSKVAGTKPGDENSFKELSAKFFEENDNCYAFGCFENETLISWISIVFAESVSRGKFWCITHLYTTKFNLYYSLDHEEIGLLVNTAYKFAESKKYYEYYYSIAARVSNVYERRIQKDITFNPATRYDLIDLDTIPANTKPSIELYWRLMGQELKPDPIIIKKRILRPEFRE